MEARRRRRSSSAMARRLCRLLALAGDYLKYVFMKRRRLLGKAAARALALINHHCNGSKHLAPSSWPLALMEHEFSCSNSPSPASLAVKRLRSRLRRGAAVSSCFGAIRRASHWSPATAAEDEEEEEEVEGEVEEEEEELDVDYRAEEFINMFYEQLRAQSFPVFLQCSP